MQCRIAIVVFALFGGALSAAPALAQPSAPYFSPITPSSILAQPKKDDKNWNGDKKDDDNGNGKKKDDDKDEEWLRYSVHGQATIVSQGNWLFRSPYTGT